MILLVILIHCFTFCSQNGGQRSGMKWEPRKSLPLTWLSTTTHFIGSLQQSPGHQSWHQRVHGACTASLHWVLFRGRCTAGTAEGIFVVHVPVAGWHLTISQSLLKFLILLGSVSCVRRFLFQEKKTTVTVRSRCLPRSRTKTRGYVARSMSSRQLLHRCCHCDSRTNLRARESGNG